MTQALAGRFIGIGCRGEEEHHTAENDEQEHGTYCPPWPCLPPTGPVDPLLGPDTSSRGQVSLGIDVGSSDRLAAVRL